MNRDEELHGYAVSMHRLSHHWGRCGCNHPPPDPDDDEQARAWGQRALAKAQEAGLPLHDPTDDELLDLGQAERAAVMARVLERLAAQNAAHRRAARTSSSPKAARRADARHLPVAGTSTTGAGQVDNDGGKVQRGPVRNEKKVGIYDTDDDNWRDF